jgi:hypothetical protein
MLYYGLIPIKQKSITMSKCKVRGCHFLDTHTTVGHKCGSCNEYGHGQYECGCPDKIENLGKFSSDIIPTYKQCDIVGCKYKWSHTFEAHTCYLCQQRGHSSYDCHLRYRAVFRIQCPECSKHTTVPIWHEPIKCVPIKCAKCDEIKFPMALACGDAPLCRECIVELDPHSEIHIEDISGMLDSGICDVGEAKTTLDLHDGKVYTMIYGGMGCAWYIRREPKDEIDDESKYSGYFLHSDNQGQYGEKLNDMPKVATFIHEYTRVITKMK